MNYYDYVTVQHTDGSVSFPTLAQFEHVTLEGATVQYGNTHNVYANTGWEGEQS